MESVVPIAKIARQNKIKSKNCFINWILKEKQKRKSGSGTPGNQKRKLGSEKPESQTKATEFFQMEIFVFIVNIL